MKTNDKKIKIAVLFVAVILSYSFIIFDVEFQGPDQPIYYAYTESIVKDHDLNVINQLDLKYHPCFFPLGEITVSPTYNFPDYHNHGGIVYWVPFYILGKFTYSLSNKFNISLLSSYSEEAFIRCAMSLGIVMLAILSVFITYLFCCNFFSFRISAYACGLMFLGTPFFYFALFETANAQILAVLISALSIWFCSQSIEMKRWHWFLYGMFFSAGLIIKIDIIFQLFFIIIFLFFSSKKNKINLQKSILFLAGFIPALILSQINSYLKYGTFHLGYLGLFTFKFCYFFEQLFSSYRGFFYTSPVLYFVIAGFFMIAYNLKNNVYTTDKEKIEKKFVLLLSLYLFLKIFVLSFRYAWGGGSPGARLLLSEYPVFVLLSGYLFQYQQKRRTTIFFYVISLLFISWNLFVTSEYIAGADINNIINTSSLIDRVKVIVPVLIKLFSVKDVNLKLYYLPILMIFLAIIIIMLRNERKIGLFFKPLDKREGFESLKLLVLLLVYFYGFYSVATMINLFNNRKNIAVLKSKNFFDKAKIVTFDSFESFENISSIKEMIWYYKAKGNKEKVDKLREIEDVLYKR